MEQYKIIIAQGHESVSAIDNGDLDFEGVLNDENLTSSVYEFNTKDEISAFMMGMEAADGWDLCLISSPIKIK